MSLELLVVMIILLVVALVVMGIFTGGIQNFTNIFGTQSDEQIKRTLCQTTCANYCYTHPPAAGETYPWAGGTGTGDKQVPQPSYKGQPITDCDARYGGKCDCHK